MQENTELETQCDCGKGETNEYEEKKSIFNGSMYFIFICYICFSLLYCQGEDCPICANIHQAEQTLRNLGTGMIAHAVVNAMPLMFILAIAGQASVVLNISLVRQKVRLNN